MATSHLLRLPLLLLLLFHLLHLVLHASCTSAQVGSHEDDGGGDGGDEGRGWSGGVAAGGEDLPVTKTRVVYPFRTDQYGHVISPYVFGRSQHPRRPRSVSGASQHAPKARRRVRREAVTEGETEYPGHGDWDIVEREESEGDEETVMEEVNGDDDGGGEGDGEEDSDDKLFIMINNEDEELFLNLTANTRLVTPYTVIEWVLEGGRRVVKTASASSGNCFYTGRLNTTSHSLVAVSNCDGLTGYIQTSDAGYFIEPLKRKGVPQGDPDLEASSPGPQPHLIYKVEDVTSRLNLSLQQDQEFQAGRKEDVAGSPSHTIDISVSKEGQAEKEATILEIIQELNRRRRSFSPLASRRPEKAEAKEEGTGARREESLGTSSIRSRDASRRRRRWSGSVPKFLRRPKFVPAATERRGRSAHTHTAEFDVPQDYASADRHRTRRNEAGEGEEATPQTSGPQAGAEEEKSGGEREENHVVNIDNDDPGNERRKGKKRRKKTGRSRACKPVRGGGGTEEGDESISERSGNNLTESNEGGCKKVGERRQRIMEERARKRQEKRRQREERRKEKERRKLENRKKRKLERRKRRRECMEAKQGDEGSGEAENCDVEEEERRERRNRRREERQKRRKEKQRRKKRKKKRKKTSGEEEETVAGESNSQRQVPDVPFSPPISSRTQDPFEGLTWDGYSPDMWETQVAAGISGLEEEEWGASPPPEEVDPEKWLELVVAVDRTVIAFHGDEAVERYVFTLFNIVSAIYEDPSLAANLHLVMLRIIFYKDAAQDQVREGQAKKSLEAVNRWAERLHHVSPAALRHDLGVWLTRVNLGGPSGYAPVSGVCQPERSCTLNRDEGLTSAFIIAHEMAHVLGMSHDGDPVAGNTCHQEGFQGSVMAPLVAATFSRFHWSSCSRSEYHTKSKNWSCLTNRPQWENATTVHSTIHYQYSLDDQCRMEFGEGYGLCSEIGGTDPCTHLWCSNSSLPFHCKTKKGPPLEGTVCGEQKWCRHGFCVAMGQELEEESGESPVRHNPRDGGWNDWGSWGPCSRTCGVGVAFRTRQCDNPKPAWGGRRCRGKREEWRLCGTEDCPLPRIDLRAQQCSILTSMVNLDSRRAALRWQPYEPRRRRKRCRISCYSHGTNEVYIGRDYVVDGTPCSYDEPDDICVQGKCVALGCDKVVGSEARVDECGVCGGDGATCSRHTHTYQQTPATEYSLVATLPAGAWNIVVQEEVPTRNFLALRDNSSSFTLNGGRSQEPSRSFISEGAKFVYTNSREREMLRARGPLLQPVSLMIHGSRAQEEVQVTTTFLTQLQQEHYQWEVGPYTACSVTCGGGEQHQTLVCRDRRTDHQVFHDRCHHLPRPALNTSVCNTFGCEARWVAGSWEHCSATCGPAGVQQRVVFCVTLPEASSANWTQGIVDPRRCSGTPRPEARRPCLRDPCPGAWTPRGWSECSSTCGEGVESRMWECVGGGGNEVTYECGPMPRQERVCFGPPCPAAPCLRDASSFCQLPVLHRYCQLPKYRDLCCHTCANVVY